MAQIKFSHRYFVQLLVSNDKQNKRVPKPTATQGISLTSQGHLVTMPIWIVLKLSLCTTRRRMGEVDVQLLSFLPTTWGRQWPASRMTTRFQIVSKDCPQHSACQQIGNSNQTHAIDQLSWKCSYSLTGTWRNGAPSG